MARERRQHERNRTCMPAWVCEGRTGLRRHGHVLNISIGGVYVLAAAETDVKVGRTVEITIGTNNAQGGFELHRCERKARVVRAERLGYAMGLALEFAGQLQRMEQQQHLMPC